MGRALVPLLVRAGHDVVGMVQRPRSVEVVHALGAEPRTADALDAAAVLSCFREVRPQVVIHQLTAIPAALDMRHFDREFALTNLLRTEGTRRRWLPRWMWARRTSSRRALPVDLWAQGQRQEQAQDRGRCARSRSAKRLRTTLDALKSLERAVLSESRVTGTVLRYGGFYGPHTSIAKDGSIVQAVRRRKLPLVGDGEGVWSFVHIDDAASATAAAVESAVAAFTTWSMTSRRRSRNGCRFLRIARTRSRRAAFPRGWRGC